MNLSKKLIALFLLSPLPFLPLAHAQQKVQKIVGGVVSNKGEFPFIISLQKTSFFGGSSHICGGSLIRSNWVLTAAHCVVGASASKFAIKIGLHNLNDSSGVEKMKATKIFVHPSYNSNTSDYDYALIKLDKASRFRTIALNRDELSIPDNQNIAQLVTVAGWGTTSEGGSIPNTLRKVTIPLASKNLCSRAYPNSITARMICAGNSSGGKDSCQGDSGGPLVIKENNGEQRLVGVVSWGDGCARPNKFGIYSKVNVGASWIDQTVARN